VLESREPRDERRRCDLLLALCDARWYAGEYERAKEAALRAAEIARKQGAAEQLARAALGFAGRLIAFAAVIRDETLIGLLEEALTALGGGDSPLRASILGRLAEEVAITDPYERREALCEEALAMARRVGDPRVLATVLRNAQWALWVPESVKERLARAYEIVRLAEEAHDRTLMVEGRFLCVWNLIELGEITRARREFEEQLPVVAELRQPYIAWGAALTPVLFAQLEGHFADAEALAQQALQLGQEAQNANATLVFGIHMLIDFYERGRWDEMEPLLGTFATAYETISQNVRSFGVLADCQRNRLADARRELEALAANDFGGLTRNLAWLFSIAFLAEGVAMLGDTRRAAILYALLAPFAGLNVTIGPVCTYGSVSRYLGLLAATMGEQERARRHFKEALAMNARMGMGHELARTQVDYAQMLLAGGDGADAPKALALINQALDTAHRLDLKPLVERGLALKLRAQGIGPANRKTSIDAITAAMQGSPRDVRAHAAPDGTVTLMFSDMEGFTEMTERLGDLRAHEVVRAHNAVVRDEVRRHGGVELELQGDGFLLAFDDPARALQCAVAIQRDLAGYSASHPEQPIRVRIGLHRGEAIRDAEKFFGKTVILAARIASQAHGAEIIVSSPLRDAVGGLRGIRFGASRDVALKGFSGMHQLHLVEWPDPRVSQ
jgi:class 3 adenylate cyclase